MFEHFFQCPYCWETVSMLLDSSVSSQTYEVPIAIGSEVCCNPIQVSPQFIDSELVRFDAINIEQ